MSRRQALEKAVADAEKRLQSLAAGIETAARSSSALTGAELDAKRMADWVDAKARDLKLSLHKLELDAKSVEHNIAAHARKFEKDLESRSATLHGLRLDLRHLRARLRALWHRHSKAPDAKA